MNAADEARLTRTVFREHWHQRHDPSAPMMRPLLRAMIRRLRTLRP